MAGKCDLPLHGLTVVVDTAGPRIYMGRYDFEDDNRLVLNHAEVRDLAAGETKEAILEKAARVGIFVNHDRIQISRSEITSIRRLSEFDSVD